MKRPTNAVGEAIGWCSIKTTFAAGQQLVQRKLHDDHGAGARKTTEKNQDKMSTAPERETDMMLEIGEKATSIVKGVRSKAETKAQNVDRILTAQVGETDKESSIFHRQQARRLYCTKESGVQSYQILLLG